MVKGASLAETVGIAREVERRAGADRSFNTCDSNKDGGVDIAELKAGLAGPLRRSFVKQLTARMGRKPDKDEVSCRWSALCHAIYRVYSLREEVNATDCALSVDASFCGSS